MSNHYSTAKGRSAHAIYVLFTLVSVICFLGALGSFAFGVYSNANKQDYNGEIDRLTTITHSQFARDSGRLTFSEFREKYGDEGVRRREDLTDVYRALDDYESKVRRQQVENRAYFIFGGLGLVLSVVVYAVGWSLRWLITGRSDRSFT